MAWRVRRAIAATTTQAEDPRWQVRRVTGAVTLPATNLRWRVRRASVTVESGVTLQVSETGSVEPGRTVTVAAIDAAGVLIVGGVWRITAPTGAAPALSTTTGPATFIAPNSSTGVVLTVGYRLRATLPERLVNITVLRSTMFVGVNAVPSCMYVLSGSP